MRYSIAVLVLVIGVGCQSGAKKAAEEKKEEAEISQRATQAASAAALKVVQDDESRRRDEAQQAALSKKMMRDMVEKSPATFLTVDNLELVNKGAHRRLDSVSLTNNSKFLVSDVRGNLDLHGDSELPGTGNDVVASIPIELTGSIAAGASMVFSVAQHNLAGGTIQLPSSAFHETFTVTGIRSVGDSDDNPKDGGS